MAVIVPQTEFFLPIYKIHAKWYNALRYQYGGLMAHILNSSEFWLFFTISSVLLSAFLVLALTTVAKGKMPKPPGLSPKGD